MHVELTKRSFVAVAMIFPILSTLYSCDILNVFLLMSFSCSHSGPLSLLLFRTGLGNWTMIILHRRRVNLLYEYRRSSQLFSFVPDKLIRRVVFREKKKDTAADILKLPHVILWTAIQGSLSNTGHKLRSRAWSLIRYTAISIYVVGSKPQAHKTRPKGNMGS